MKTKSLLSNRQIIENVQLSHEIKLSLEIWNPHSSCCKPKKKLLVAIHMLQLYLINHVKNVLHKRF